MRGNAARPGTPKGERLAVLATLVEAWERIHTPMELPDPIEAIKFRMEQSGLTAKDLVPMIRRLHKDLGIPAESLIRPSAERRAA